MNTPVSPILLVLAFGFATACTTPPAPTAGQSSSSAPSAPAPREIDVATLKADLDAGRVPFLLDVRTPGEFGGGHVAGAVNIPVSDLQGRLAELEGARGKPVYVICQSGGRSAAAAKLLSGKGFETLNVSGGTGAWVAAGLPVEK